MRPPERGHLARVRVLAGVCAISLVVAGCSRLTFVKPDLGRGDFERTAPELDITTDDRSKGAGAARVAVQHGQVAFTQGKIEDARRFAEQALELDPDSAAAHTLRAVVADRAGNSRLAGRHYQRAVELAPYLGGMHNNYGTWLCANGREQESLQWFEQALADRNYPTPAAALANAGACARKAGAAERAVRYLDAALEIDPANPVALAAMAEHEFRAGRAFQARAFSQRRLAAAPADAASLVLASQIEQKLGDKEAADRYVQRLRAEFPAASGSGTGDDGKR
jgi:type IV pilus assembly protein PilF